MVPPQGWAPPFALDKGTNGLDADSFRFSIRKQLTSHLTMRNPNTRADRKRRAAGRWVLAKPWQAAAAGPDPPESVQLAVPLLAAVCRLVFD